ncbi:TetR/AcrR family transcriptional regulator [Paenibacillus glycanilyticus]|uniref:TetR/AcrR family transcriptional regulator n=1 Tax=Paenibacillus glycanilyticus TaxID=126569 RepID=UPI00203FF9ED|nr:TetR/AcrR family transcriptional regulator [Paenibacillus glycanilyticus]MCM3630273.1 TetR/AcrR family transcriptional regulator [Paenibacillus glycanilyticus]
MENRKTQIIELASSLIRKKGYSTFSYEEISKHFSVTKASIHYHFEKKEDLGLAVLDRLYQALLNYRSVLQQSSKPAEEKLYDCFIDLTRHFEKNDISLTTSLKADYCMLPESMKQKLQEIVELELSTIDEIVAEGIDDPAVNTRALAITILSTFEGALQYNRAMQKDFIPDIMYGINRLLRR